MRIKDKIANSKPKLALHTFMRLKSWNSARHFIKE